MPAFAVLAALFVFYLLCGAGGYGNDGDTYAMLRAGWTLVHNGAYLPSRSPGYPLPELLIGMGGGIAGHWGSNAVSSLMGCIALGCFYALLRAIFEKTNALLAVCAVGLNPYWIVAASSSMDYVYGAAFFLMGLVVLRKERLYFAAFCFAACAASRLTYAPVILLAYVMSAWRRKDVPPFRMGASAALFLGMTALAYLPVYHALGTRMFQVTISNQHVAFLGAKGFASFKPYLQRFLYKNVFLWGIPSFAILIAVGVCRRKCAAAEGKIPSFLLWGAWTAIFYYEVLFLRLPMEIPYLIPVLFLVAFLLNGVPHGRVFLALILAGQLLQSLVVFDFTEVVYARQTLDAVEASGFRFHPGFHRGVLWEDLFRRGTAQSHWMPLFFEDPAKIKP